MRVGDADMGVDIAHPSHIRQRFRHVPALLERGDELGAAGDAGQLVRLLVDLIEFLQPRLAAIDFAAHDRSGRQLQRVVCAGLLIEQRKPVGEGFGIAVHARVGQGA
jgi:hypothetical protein